MTALGGPAIGSGKKSSNVRVSPGKIEAKSMISGAPGVDRGLKMGQYFGCWKEGIAKQLQNPRRRVTKGAPIVRGLIPAFGSPDRGPFLERDKGSPDC